MVWSQIILPVTATLLYAVILLLCGKELFYKSAIPVWMIALYYACSITNYKALSPMIMVLCWIVLLFFSLVYTHITAGRGKAWLLLPLFACSLLALLYLKREALLAANWASAIDIAPDILLFLGWIILVFAIRFYPADQYHPTWGDRTDGRLLRSRPPMDQVAPYIMVNRNGSTNLFSESLEITNAERYVRQKRREGLTNFGLTHVLLAAYLRTLCKYPGLNRFLAGQKVFSRGDDVQFCITIKKDMSALSPETVSKLHFRRQDTADAVYHKLNAEVEKVKNTPLDSTFDNVAHTFTMIPGVILKFTVWLLKTLDYFGLVPKFLLEVSPFHGSIFFTSMGSLGIPPIYHHLYDFGNLPVFGAFGCKRRTTECAEDGTLIQRKYMDIRFSLDERIVDGFYYAAFFKHFRRIVRNPEILDLPPDEVVADID